MKSIKFDTETGSIPLVNGDFVMLDGKEAIKQNIIAFLHITKGEYFLNKNYGIDFFNTGYTTSNRKALFDAEVLKWLKKKKWIKSISGYSSKMDNDILTVTIDKIYTVDGDFKVEVEI